MTQDDFAALSENTVERRDLQIRQVANGYTMTGVRHFLDNETMTEKFSIGLEGVAENEDNALKAIQNFYANGTW